MRKIPTVFLRDEADRRHVLPVANPECAWVFAGEGTATRKYDGTCVWLDGAGRWWSRREVKPDKSAPPNWLPVDYDEVTGKRMGWEPIEQSSFAKFHAEAVAYSLTPGTYELIGPKVNGNPEATLRHVLVNHADAMTPDHLLDASVGDNTPPWQLVRFVGRKYGWEGIVWHHPDGRMAKLKARDLPPQDCGWS